LQLLFVEKEAGTRALRAPAGGDLAQDGRKLGEQSAEGAAAMAERVLFFAGNFGHRKAELREPE
jgi:hypothetical protein